MTGNWFKLLEVATLREAIEAYEGVHSTGGSLHIVLDDGNWRRSDIEHCAAWAAENGDLIGEAIAKTLLKMPDDTLALAQGTGNPIAKVCNAWSRLIILEDRRARGVTHIVTVTGNGSHHECEHSAEAEAREDFEYRVAAANEEANVRRSYRIEMAPLGGAPIVTHDKLAATHWKDQPGANTL